MLTSGLFTDCGQITKTSNIAATFQSIAVVKIPVSTHLMENLSQGRSPISHNLKSFNYDSNNEKPE